MAHVIVAGGSGFLGRSLARTLRGRGDAVSILTRSPRERSDGAAYTNLHEAPRDIFASLYVSRTRTPNVVY